MSKNKICHSENELAYAVRREFRKCRPDESEVRYSPRIQEGMTDTSEFKGSYHTVFILIDIKLGRERFMKLWDPVYRALYMERSYPAFAEAFVVRTCNGKGLLENEERNGRCHLRDLNQIVEGICFDSSDELESMESLQHRIREYIHYRGPAFTLFFASPETVQLYGDRKPGDEREFMMYTIGGELHTSPLIHLFSLDAEGDMETGNDEPEEGGHNDE